MPRDYKQAGSFEPSQSRWVKRVKGIGKVYVYLGDGKETETKKYLNLDSDLWTKELSFPYARAKLAEEPKKVVPLRIPREGEIVIPQGIKAIIGKVNAIQDENNPVEFRQYLADEFADDTEIAPEKSVKLHLADWLKAEKRGKRGRAKMPSSWAEVQMAVKGLPWENQSTAQIKERTVLETRDWLDSQRITERTKKHRAVIIKRFFLHLWKQRAIELPRNLDDLISYDPEKRVIKRYALDLVQGTLATMPERLRVWALLGLNCGMTQADIAVLSPAQIKDGKLTRKRVKTAKYDDVPTVTYKLWPETIEALETPDSDSLWFTSRTGEPLLTQRIEDGKVKVKDLCKLAWKRAKLPIMLKNWKSISATYLESNKEFGRYVEYFLGHTAKSVAEKHYAEKSNDLLAEATDWLRMIYFPNKRTI